MGDSAATREQVARKSGGELAHVKAVALNGRHSPIDELTFSPHPCSLLLRRMADKRKQKRSKPKAPSTPRDKGELLFVWKLNGERFADNGIDLRDLPGLLAQQTLIVEFAKQLWTEENRPIPASFEEKIRLVFYEVGIGSSPLAVYLSEPPSRGYVEPKPSRQLSIKINDDEFFRRRIRRATAMAAIATRSAVRGEAPPFKLSDKAAKELPHVLDMLKPGDEVHILLPADVADYEPEFKDAAPVSGIRLSANDNDVAPPLIVAVSFSSESSESVKRSLASSTQQRGVLSIATALIEAPIDIMCDVTRINTRDQSASVEHGDRLLQIGFSSTQEQSISEALFRRKTSRLRIVGKGMVPWVNGPVDSVTEVHSLECVNPSPAFDFFELDSRTSVRIHVEPKPGTRTRPAEHSEPDLASRSTSASVVETSPRTESAESALDTMNVQPRPKWESPCEAMFEYLAENDPAELIKFIEEATLRPAHLTFAAEAAGRIHDHSKVVQPLLKLLSDKSPMVREGAIYGLAGHLDDDVMERLREVAERDPIEGVRLAAESALENQ